MKTIALFFGGLGNEAAVSVMSAKNVVKNFDYKRYKLKLVYWSKKDTRFYLIKDINKLNVSSANRLAIEDWKKSFDIALLMTHGRYGEDGVLQAIFESQKIKYCGCRVLGSAVCMDKALFKNLLKAENINQVKFTVIDLKANTEMEIKIIKEKIKKTFKLPLYIKPANSGSSVGITKVDKFTELEAALNVAFKHDSKIVIEEGLTSPKEVEVAVLGNDKLIVSFPGELRLVKDFYNYDDKYKLGQAEVIIPAKIPTAQIKTIKKMAEEIYRLASCQGFSRLDFFVSKNKIYFNEINTLPGFTDISMFPMLMMNLKMSYQELLNKIIEIAY